MNVSDRDLRRNREPEGLICVGGFMHGERIRDVPVRDWRSERDYARDCLRQTYRVWLPEPGLTFSPTDPVEIEATIQTITYEIRDVFGLTYLEGPDCVLSRMLPVFAREPAMNEFIHARWFERDRTALIERDLAHLRYVFAQTITYTMGFPIHLDDEFRIHAREARDQFILFDDPRFGDFAG
ncbi:MAG: hypothetical protein KF889_04940 [Alphaproteobacteria bacterium]|nr:hypothetical protein [Alphaproteobacteria bacterium]MCW5742215.1 hypothetical protein [Alphaproteobacteria bacterium]